MFTPSKFGTWCLGTFHDRLLMRSCATRMRFLEMELR